MLVGVVNLVVVVSFASCREKYSSNSGPFPQLRESRRLLMYHDAMMQRECGMGC